MRFWKKSLAKRDPATLSVDELCLLEEVLILKLIQITAELETRWRNIVELGLGLSGVEESRKSLLAGADRQAALNARLQDELNSN